jgi:hypothetical protein
MHTHNIHAHTHRIRACTNLLPLKLSLQCTPLSLQCTPPSRARTHACMHICTYAPIMTSVNIPTYARKHTAQLSLARAACNTSLLPAKSTSPHLGALAQVVGMYASSVKAPRYVTRLHWLLNTKMKHGTSAKQQKGLSLHTEV